MAKAFVMFYNGNVQNTDPLTMTISFRMTLGGPDTPTNPAVDSIEVTAVDIPLNATPARIARAVVDRAIERALDFSVTLDDSDVIFQGFERG
jgi:hypothetical protein